MDYEDRIDRLRSAFQAHPLDALLITNLVNVQYLTGFTGTNGQLLITATRTVFMSDPRYEARARSLVQGSEVAIYPSRLTDRLGPLLQETKAARLGLEAKTMTIAERDDLAKRLPEAELAPTTGLVEEVRRSKEPAEVDAIRAAIALGDSAFSWVLDRIRPAMTERQLALDLELKMREEGAQAVSFPPIIGSGPLSAHIHHSPSERELEKGDLVLLDFGCRLDGYCSDLTRTVVMGSATDEQRRLHDLVLSAQRVGIEAVAAGVTGVEADAAARAVIETAQLGERFGHGLGHGVGLDIHEAPRLHRISEDTLRVSDVVTVEPGVYVPEMGGIRIEDCVLVTARGAEVLGDAPKAELIEL